MLVDPEVEHHVDAVAAGEVPAALVGRHVRLGKQYGIAAPPLHHVADLVHEPEVGLRRPAIQRRLLLEHERQRVDAEAGNAQLQPVAHDAAQLLAHVRVFHVQVGLVVIEAVVVPLARLRVARPGVALHAREDGARSPVRRPPLRPPLPVPGGRVAALARSAKPGMPVGGVVGDEVDDHADAAAVRLAHELDEVPRRAEPGGDVVVVADVVAVVAQRAGLERRQPERIDAEALEVVEPAGEPLEVATAVAVAVHERLDRQAVDDGVLVPEIGEHTVHIPQVRSREPVPVFPASPQGEPPSPWQATDTFPGGGRPSSTRSTRGHSSTPTATASATCPGSSGGLTTCPGSASMPCGSRRSTGLRWRTSATTSATTATSTRCSAPWRTPTA